MWKKEHSLAELVSTDQFKTYDELKKRLDSVLKLTPAPVQRRQEEELLDEDNGREEVAVSPATAEGDDALSYFQRLAEE